MARLRFVHAADLHLDSPFRGIRSEAPDHVAQTLSSATFDAYQNKINLCIQEQGGCPADRRRYLRRSRPEPPGPTALC